MATEYHPSRLPNRRFGARIALAALPVLLGPGLPTPASAHGAPAEGADTAGQNNGFSLGMNLHRFQDDFGMSLIVGTPTLFGDSTRFTVGGGIAWYPYRELSDGTEVWEWYGHTRAVVEGGGRIEGLPLRLYGVGGLILLLTPDRLASRPVHPGGYGGFGFEFYMPRAGRDGPVSYLVELGGIGTGAQADNAIGTPIFANGFLVTVGMRVYP
jgi:hypothetical protein